MTRYWMGVASLEHVQRGVSGGFAQVCHGKIGTLKFMSEGDWLIYYSPTYSFGGKDPCRSFTAIGRVDKGEPYMFKMGDDFIPWRRDVTFRKSKMVPIVPLLEELSFIKDKKRWGFPFRRGSFEILRQDFELIAKQMGVFTGDTGKLGNLTRRCPKFLPGLPASKQRNLNKLSDADGPKFSGYRHSQNSNFPVEPV